MRRCQADGWLVLVVGSALFVAAASVAGYGLDLSDEGYIVYPAVQVAAGLVPYRDVNSLYTPLAWYLHAGLFKLVGVELLALRTLFAALASGLIVGSYLLARQFVAPRLAVVPLVAYALLFPIPQRWAPYPAWYALGGLLIGLAAMHAFVADRRARWLAVAGLGCGVAFGTKPNLGVFGLIAFGGFLALQARALAPGAMHGDHLDGQRLDARQRGAAAGGGLLTALQAGLVLGVVAAFGLLIGGVATPGNIALLLGLLGAAGAVLIEGPRPVALRPVLAAVVGRWAVLVGGFLVVSVPWYVPLSMAAGWELTFDSVFRNGARTAAAFYEPIDLPNRDAWEAIGWVLGGVLVTFGLGQLAARRPRASRVGLVVGAALVVSAALAAWRAAAAGVDLPGYVVSNVAARAGRPAIEETDFLMYLPLLALGGGIGRLAWRRRRGTPAVYEMQLGLLVWFLALLLFQLYPRASYLHLLFSIGPFLVLVGVLRAEVWQAVAPRLPTSAWRAVAFAPLLVFPALMVPGAWRARAEVLAQDTLLGLPHAGVRTTAANAARLRLLAAEAAALPPGAPIFAYPAVPIVYLVTDHPNPTREDYLPSGYVDEAGQRAAIERLEATQTRLVVWDQQLVDRWGLRASDRPLVDYIWSRYRPVASEGGWIILESRPDG